MEGGEIHRPRDYSTIARGACDAGDGETSGWRPRRAAATMRPQHGARGRGAAVTAYGTVTVSVGKPPGAGGLGRAPRAPCAAPPRAACPTTRASARERTTPCEAMLGKQTMINYTNVHIATKLIGSSARATPAS